MADDSKSDRVDPLFEVAGQIVGEFGVPDQIEVATYDGEPVQVHLVYEGGGDAGPDSDRGSGRTGRTFGYSGKKDPKKGARYVFLRDRPDEPAH